jgi:hypothetical protein
MKYLLLFFPVFSFAQITHLKTVTAQVKGFGDRELICVTFYRGSKVGFDLATHEGNLIGKCEVMSLRRSERTIDSSAVHSIIRAFNDREERRRGTERGQALLIGTSLLIIKHMLDTKLDWR